MEDDSREGDEAIVDKLEEVMGDEGLLRHVRQGREERCIEDIRARLRLLRERAPGAKEA